MESSNSMNTKEQHISQQLLKKHSSYDLEKHTNEEVENQDMVTKAATNEKSSHFGSIFQGRLSAQKGFNLTIEKTCLREPSRHKQLKDTDIGEEISCSNSSQSEEAEKH